MLQPGQAAPTFELPDADMQTVDLSAFKGKKHVGVVLGVSRDDCLPHADFRDRHGVTIALLSDTEGEVCRKYGVLQEKEVEGAGRRECLVRSTFVIDKKGVIRHVT